MIPFQFDPRAEKVEYFLIYNSNDLLADIGGYLGLFLGLSCFGIVELFGKLFSSSAADVNRSEKKIKEDYAKFSISACTSIPPNWWGATPPLD